MSGDAILIVDDNPTNLKLVRILLLRKGYDIRTAQDADEALLVLNSFKPKLILMDIQLPGMDGLQLTRHLKAIPKYHHTIIIAITAYAMKGDEEKAIAAGCDGYIAKPIDTRALPNIIATYLKKKTKIKHLKTEVEPIATNKQLIFIIEDNPTTRKVLKITLEHEHYSVVVAESGESALQKIKTCKPDLILLDLILPDTDGFELSCQLRTIPYVKDIPIIALTGFFTKFDNPDLMNHSNFTAFLFKPVENTLLLQAIQSYLPQVKLESKHKANRQHLFILDDNVMQLKSMQIQFKKAGFKVSISSDSKNAINEIRANMPDVIISDVLMPQIDGFELCLQIRNDPELRAIPIILLTSHYLEEADHKLAKKVGANEFFTRSTTVTQLIDVIENGFKATPSNKSIESLVAFKEEHVHRLIRQLERQVEANSGLAELCALQSAQLSLLGGVAETLTSSDGIDNTLHDVLSMCLDAAGISKGMLFLINQNEELVLKQVIGYEQAKQNLLMDFFGQHQLLELAIIKKKIIQIPGDEVSVEAMNNLFDQSHITSGLIIPLISRTTCLGILFLGSQLTDVTLGEPLTFARILGIHIGQTISLASTFERLFLSEEQHRILMDNASCGILVHNLAGQIVEANKHVELLLNSSKEEIIGQYFKAFIFPADLEFANKQYAVFLEEGVIGPNEIRIQPKNAAPRVVEYTGAIVKTLKEDFLLIVTNDVTDRNQIRSRALLNDKLAAIGTLAAGMAHEINNPIAWILANLGFMKESIHKLQTNLLELENICNEPDSQIKIQKIDALLVDMTQGKLVEEMDEIISESIEGIDRIRGIVDSLRGFSRMNDSRLVPIDIAETIDSVIKIAFSEIKYRAKIKKIIPRNLPKITSNSVKLHQVFLNLILNAAQSIAKGTIEENTILIKAELMDNIIQVDICDTGSGIPPEYLSRIFDPFFTTKPIGTGTGLGLSICHDIIQECGGEIKVQSILGKGSTFSVYLPLELK